MADRFALVGTVLADRYRVDGLVAEGGFAAVYRAHQLALDRPVAIKVLKTPAELDATARARFADRFASEAKTIAHLRHPHIVDVYDFGVTRMPAGVVVPWMALEWLDGETLETDLARRRGAGGRSPAEAIALLRPVIEALAYAHNCGVIHRDIKPANLMITGPSKGPVPPAMGSDGRSPSTPDAIDVQTTRGPLLRMLDFGIAKTMDDGETGSRPGGSGAAGFSPDYASPEQVTYSRTGPWTDVHALGLLFCELLTDEPPFSDGPDDVLFEQIMSAAHPTPARRSVNAGALEAIVGKAVALSPSRRWRDAGALLAALDKLAARPASLRAPRIRRSAVTATTVVTAVERRRNDMLVAGAGGLGVLALFAVLVSTLSAGDGRHASVSEELALAQAALAPQVVHAQLPGVSARVAPSIVPLPACVEPAAGAPPPLEPMLAARRPSRPRAPLAAPPLPRPPVPDVPCAMTINSLPWSEVSIDGRNTGRHTPFVDYELGCGRHRIEFRRPDLQLAQSELIVVKPGQTFKRAFTLDGSTE